MKFAYQNEKIKKIEDVKISPYDLGFLRSYCIFDVARTTQSGKFFLLDEHYQRLKKSTKAIGLKFDVSKKVFQKIIYDLMKKNNLKKTVIRTVVSGGESKDSFTFSGKENIVIFLEKFILPKKEFFEKGVNICSIEFSREIPKIKTTNYLKALSEQKNKKKYQAYEILYLKNKKVLEASTANVFIIKNKNIFTPKNDILQGVTRNLIIKLLKKKKVKVFEKDIREKMLRDADEVFLTATNKNILPVVKIDNKKIADGKVGEMTKKIMEIFADFEQNYY